MNRGLLAVLTVALVLGTMPVASGQDGGDDGEDCITPPEVEATYEWAYELSNGRTRYIEAIDEGPATTPRGHHNVTEFEFAEEDEDGQIKAWGQQVRYAPNSPYPWALATQDHWEQTEEGELRRLDSYDPPFRTIHYGQETCPGQFWRFETHHEIAYGEYGQAGQQEANETWQVQAGAWTNVTVPEGTYEVLPISAVRESDEYQITTYWSPEVRGPAMVEQGPAGTTTSTRELTWHILDQRPTPIFQVLPEHPQVGDVITLNATASFDPEGNITEYRWHVGEETRFGRVVEIDATEERTLDIRLFVTDEADRTATLGTTRYIAPEEGSGIGVSGPTEAYSGRVVSLEAHASFDPVDVRWREGSTVVGKGEVFQFRMEQTRNLSVDAFHPSGRVYTANHTVEFVERSQATEGSSGAGGDDASDRYPPGGSDELAILDPLEGQLVPTNFDVTVRAKDSARLAIDGRPIWQGTANTSHVEPVPELAPGAHTLTLESSASSQTVNVTVAADGTRSVSDETETSGSEEDGSAGSNPVPGPSAALIAAVAALAGLTARRPAD